MGLMVLVLILFVLTGYPAVAVVIIGLLILYLVFTRIFQPKKTQLPRTDTRKPAGIRFTVSFGPSFSDFRPTSRDGEDFWVPLTKKASLARQELGGMVYFGRGLAAVNGNNPEPALIDPDLPVTMGMQDYSVRQLSYWPYYRAASPEARGAYLKWLSTGRQDSSADLGYVFLYFYGLERRVLHDVKTSSKAVAETPGIISEILRLLHIYERSGSFQSYGGSLLDLLKAQSISPGTYKREPPSLRMGRFLTIEHKIALGQCSRDGAPLPADWAFVLLMSDPRIHFHKPASRCPVEYRNLFLQKYHEAFGEGIILPDDAKQLNISHRTASPTFQYGNREFSKSIDLPDISFSSIRMDKLHRVAQDCESSLNNYSRLVGKDASLIGGPEAIIELPIGLWPAQYQTAIKQLQSRIRAEDASTVMPFRELLSTFPRLPDMTRQRIQSLYRAFAEIGLGIEPDVRFGGDVPELDSHIVLFADSEKHTSTKASPRYLATSLILQLGAGVAASDGSISDQEEGFLLRQLGTGLGLSESERIRLRAKLRLWRIEPPKTSGLKKRIQGLDSATREAVGHFLAAIALADEKVSNEEIRTLEKVFTLLDLDRQTLYAELQVGATAPVTVRLPTRGAGGHAIPRPPSKVPTQTFRLDEKRLKALQEDSERVASILGSIFDQSTNSQKFDDAGFEPDKIEQESETLVQRLDKEFSSLVSVLISRAKWSRAELERLASERKLMLDGVLERVNDAFYAEYNKPLFEGFDPIEISPEMKVETRK